MKKNILIIVSTIILLLIILFKIQNIYLEKYKETTFTKQKIARATFMIINDEEKTSYSSTDITLNDKMIGTFRSIINSNTIQNKVKEQYPDVVNIELETEKGTSIINAIYVCGSYSDKDCIDITNKYVELFKKYIVDIYNIDNFAIVNSTIISTRLIKK